MAGPAQVDPAILAEVATAAADDAGGLDPALLGDFLPTVAAAVARGSRLTAAQIGRYRARGRDAARQGIALRALLDLYLSAAWRLWRQLPVAVAAADPGAIVTAAEVVLRAADDAVAELTEGYQLARRSLIREEEAARREFIDDLLSGHADVAGLLNRAGKFGLDLTGPHAVVVGRAEQPFADGTALIAKVERVVQGSKGDADALVATKQKLLVVVFAAPDARAVVEVTSAISDLFIKGRVASWRLGVGRPGPGASGILASYEEARDSLELAARLGLAGPVIAAAELLIYRVLLRDRPAIEDLVTSTLTPLCDARGGADPLLSTLAAYFEAGGNTAMTARKLHLSVRAVTYRLQRVRSLTGCDPVRGDTRFVLHAAVLAARLLNWPAEPLAAI